MSKSEKQPTSNAEPMTYESRRMESVRLPARPADDEAGTAGAPAKPTGKATTHRSED